jgi:glutamine cyclotransferase
VSLNPEYFAEGLTIFENQLIQLTWQNRLGLVYDLETMELLRTFRYGMEGWGLTHDSTRLYLSDGSSMIYTLDPQSFQMTGNFEVCDHQGAVNQLNELEFRDGRIWANIYGADRIIAFNPLTGEVTHELNLQNLFDRKQYGAYTDVLNGIAFLPESGHMLVTGKLWPSLFELKWSEEAQ